MDYAKIIESMKGLITENTSVEEASAISEVVKELEGAKKEHEDTLIKHEELRQKYIKALQNSAFNDPNAANSQNDTPKTLEECIQDVIAKRKQQLGKEKQ